MDVVCERCQTEYEFDDALASERGTTVKCTNCGHQFKIYRRSGEAAEARPWMLRRADGSTITFDTLAVLQKWIVEGRVTRNDQISRDGAEWKALGSIAELESFFATAELRSAPRPAAASRLPSVPPKPTPPPTTPMRAMGRPPSAPPPLPSAGGTLRPPAAPPPPTTSAPAAPTVATPRPSTTGTLYGPGAAVAPPPAPATTAPPPSATATAGFTMGAELPQSDEKFDFGETTGILESWGEGRKGAAPASVKPAPAIGPPPVARPSSMVRPAPRERPPSAEVSDDAVTTSQDAEALGLPTARRRGGISGTLVGVGIGIAVAAIGGVVAWRAGVFGGATPTTAAAPDDRAAEAIVRAERSARGATRAGYDEAREQLTALLASNPDAPRMRAARAAVLALWGEQVRQRAEDLEARAAQGGPDAAAARAEAAVLRRDATASLDRARQDYTVAESGTARVTGTADRVRFERALGEVARVLGDESAARRHLEAARAAGGGPDVDLLAALLERDAGQADAAVTHLRALTTQEDTAVRARLALARLLAARGDAAGARAEAEAVVRMHAGHEDAQALAQAIAAGQPPLQRGASTAAPATDSGAVALAPGGAGGTTGGTSGGFAGRSYDALIEEGERLQERGQRERARAAFMAAMAARPEGSEAITGLGFVELDANNPSVAIAHFRRALSINPRYSEAYIGLGEAYSHQGNTEAALRAYREYLNVNPGGSRARMAQNQIEQLERRLGGGAAGATPGGTTPAPGATGGGESAGGAGSSGGGSSGGGSGAAGSGSSGGGGGSGSSGGSGGANSGGSTGGEAPTGGGSPGETPPSGT
jgi:predicted Zn finger-like uncharacterized protein